jgi:hypothetical protein
VRVKRPRTTPLRDGKRVRRKAPPPAGNEARTRHVPPYGDIPLLVVTYVDDQGRERECFEYDPDHAPPLPPGAVRGDIRKQHYCQMCHDPRYFYVDVGRTCAQCGLAFVFSAAEQKHWYETLKFHFLAKATRCLACRRKRRSQRALTAELMEAKQRAQQSPEQPDVQLALAEAIVRHHQGRGTGSLDEALAASRKARRLLRGHPARELRETLFWEGMAHALAGRTAPARERLLEFISADIAGRRSTALAKEARAWLELHGRS